MERLQTRNACRHGTLADAVHLQTWNAADMDRSEIGPYLGGHRTRCLIGLHPGFLRQTLPYLSTSEVGRFLRKRQRKGTRNICRHATPADMERLRTRYTCRHGTPKSRTARRSVPTSEVIGRHSGFLPSKLIGLHPGFLRQTQPHQTPSVSSTARVFGTSWVRSKSVFPSAAITAKKGSAERTSSSKHSKA